MAHAAIETNLPQERPQFVNELDSSVAQRQCRHPNAVGRLLTAGVANLQVNLQIFELTINSCAQETSNNVTPCLTRPANVCRTGGVLKIAASRSTNF
jgi:hypothetical protein